MTGPCSSPGSRCRMRGCCAARAAVLYVDAQSPLTVSLGGARVRGRSTQAAALDLDAIDLSDRDFWVRPPAERHAVFDLLRRERPFAFFAEPAIPMLEPGPGYYAVTRYADLDAISSQPAVFCSGKGAVSIIDIPADLNEFYGSLISMDDPRHAKIRRIVSKAFTPRMLERLVGSVQEIVDDVLAAARRKAEDGDGTHRRRRRHRRAHPAAGHLRHDGRPRGGPGAGPRAVQHRAVRGRPRADREPGRPADRVPRGGHGAGRRHGAAGGRAARAADATTSPPRWCTTEVDGERLTHARRSPRSSSCCWSPATRPPATPSPRACSRCRSTPSSGPAGWPTRR